MFLMNRIITENKRQQSELNKQKITERELTNLNQKIVSFNEKQKRRRKFLKIILILL